MRAIPVAVALTLLAACGRPYHQKKNGDVDVALVLERNGCNGSQKKERACKMIRAFGDAEGSIATPDERDRYLGWFRPIGPGGASYGEAVSLVLEKKNGRTEATLIVLGKSGPETATLVDEWLAGKKKTDLDEFFQTEEVSRKLERVEGSPSARLQMMDRYTYMRRDDDAKRVFILHVGSIPETSMHYGYTKAPVWVGELRQVD